MASTTVSTPRRAALRQGSDVAARALLAIAGGYAIAALASAGLALALPLPRPQAVLTATMLSFALHCAVAIWAFSAASVHRAWFGALASAALPAAYLLLVLP